MSGHEDDSNSREAHEASGHRMVADDGGMFECSCGKWVI